MQSTPLFVSKISLSISSSSYSASSSYSDVVQLVPGSIYFQVHLLNGSPIKISTHSLITSFMPPNIDKPIRNHSNVLGSLSHIIYKYSNESDSYCPLYSSSALLFLFVSPFSLQASQKFLNQKMLQKTLKICVILPAFFDPRNGGKHEICLKDFRSKNVEET